MAGARVQDVGAVGLEVAAAVAGADGGVKAWCGVGAFVGGEEAGEKAGDEGAEEREAGADDAHVCFDAGPGRCAGVVVGWICGVGDGDELRQSEDGDYADEATDGEDTNQCSLLSLSKVEASNDGHGHYDYQKVLQNIDTGIGEPHGELIKALCIRLLGPKSSDIVNLGVVKTRRYCKRMEIFWKPRARP